MSRARGASPVLPAVLVVAAMAAAPTLAGDASHALRAGEAEARAGRVAEAAEAYAAAARAAETTAQQVQAVRALTEGLPASPEAAPETRAALERAGELYGEILRQAEGEERLLVHNNRAAVLLRLGRAEEAARLLAAIEPEMAAPQHAAARPVYLHNYGRALEAAGRLGAAAERYRAALTAAPALEPAADALMRLALGSDAPAGGIPLAVDLIERLTAAGELEPAAHRLRQALAHEPWAGEPGHADLVLVLARYLIAATVGPRAYAELWADELRALAPRLSPPAPVRLRDIERAYLEDFPVMLDRGWARSVWGDGLEDVAFEQPLPLDSALLKIIADGYVRDDALEPAFPRYVLAWNLDRENSEAGVRMVNLLLQRPEALDPDGHVLDELVVHLFEGKGDAYLGRDWPNIRRFHTLLGMIFEERGQWGPANDPRSALFQWEHALRAQEEVARAAPHEATALPALHERVATAYTELGRPAEASRHYTAAVGGYLELDNPGAARAALGNAGRLGLLPDMGQVERIEDLERRLQQRPLTPQQIERLR